MYMAVFINSRNDRLYSVLPNHQYQLMDVTSDRRIDAEAAVKNIFRKAYGADINEFSPMLLCAQQQDQIDTVIGLRCAQGNQLFLESYLDLPIEEVIYQQCKIEVPRDSLVELGNLVAQRSGSSRQLFITLAFALEAAEVQWACFTATGQVKQLLRKLRLNPIELCKAQQRAVIGGDSSWGGYYDQSPTVCFGNVYQAVSQLRELPTVIAIYPQIENEVNLLAEQIRKGFNKGSIDYVQH